MAQKSLEFSTITFCHHLIDATVSILLRGRQAPVPGSHHTSTPRAEMTHHNGFSISPPVLDTLLEERRTGEGLRVKPEHRITSLDF